MVHWNDILPLAAPLVAALGCCLIWATHLSYRAHRRPGDEVSLVLRIVGWLLVVLPFVVPVLVAATGNFAEVVAMIWGVVIVGGTVVTLVALAGRARHRVNERRALWWALAVADEKGIPLTDAARAFGWGNPDRIGRQAEELAADLADGVPLAQAAKPTNVDDQLALEMGARTGALGPALRRSLERRDNHDSLRNMVEQYSYFLIVGIMLLSVIAYTLIRIVPVMARMFDEFELSLPQTTIAMVNVAQHTLLFSAVPLLLLLLVVMSILAALYYLELLRLDVPLLGRLALPVDAGRVLGALGLAVERQRPLPEMLRLLAARYPKARIRHRLAIALHHVNSGSHWCDALQVVKLITPAEAAVLKSAERAGNLSWALDEMADRKSRRLRNRLRVVDGVLFPLTVVLFGGIVGFYALGMFLPLIALIDGLA